MKKEFYKEKGTGKTIELLDNEETKRAVKLGLYEKIEVAGSKKQIKSTKKK